MRATPTTATAGRLPFAHRAGSSWFHLLRWMPSDSALGGWARRRSQALNRRIGAYLERSASPPEPVPLETVENLDPKRFREQYLRTNTPVVLKGAALDWAAVGKWSPDFFAEQYGDRRIPLLDGRNWKVRNDVQRGAVSTATRFGTFRELIEDIRAGGPLYCPFLPLLETDPRLRDDLDFGAIARYGGCLGGLPWQALRAKLYVGGQGTATSLHHAGISNLYVQIHGRKRWILHPPDDSALVYPVPNRSPNIMSYVDFRQPDHDAHPLYRYARTYELVLEPGDILWNPPFTWHAVQNESESVAVSFWWVRVLAAMKTRPLMTWLIPLSKPNPFAILLGLTNVDRNRDEKDLFKVHFGN